MCLGERDVTGWIVVLQLNVGMPEVVTPFVDKCMLSIND
jgi:hypothetical protein